MSKEALSHLIPDPPESFASLPAADTEFLAGKLREQRAARADGLEEAARKALDLVPALARGPVRRILFR